MSQRPLSPRRSVAHPAARAIFEPLEPRRLLAAASGTVFEDLNDSFVQDPGEAGIPGRVVYLDLNRNGARDDGERATTTDDEGGWRISGLPGVEPGRPAFAFRQEIPDGSSQIYPRQYGQPAGDFDIEIQFADPDQAVTVAGGETVRVADVFAAAARRWEQVITRDVADAETFAFADDLVLPGGSGDPGVGGVAGEPTDPFDPALFNVRGVPGTGRPVDDLLIVADVSPIDGPGGTLGQAGPIEFRGRVLDPFTGEFFPDADGDGQDDRFDAPDQDDDDEDDDIGGEDGGLDPGLGEEPEPLVPDDFLPISGAMQFDSEDIADLTLDQFYGVVLHEMGHILGIGTLWEGLGLLDRPGPRLIFDGPAATREYNNVFGLSADGVPYENTGGPGTAEGHWRETTVVNELMGPYIDASDANLPLSRFTAASLQDTGYGRTYANAADFYSPPGEASLAPGFYDLRRGDAAFAHTTRLRFGEEERNLNFAVRENLPPEVVGVRAPAFVDAGTPFDAGESREEADDVPAEPGLIPLRALGVDGADDRIYAVTFYRESNGRRGLQTGPGGDTFIARDESPDGGWRTTASAAVDPTATGADVELLDPGVYTFYARALDEHLAVADARAAVTIVGAQAAPAAPTGVVADAIDQTSIEVRFAAGIAEDDDEGEGDDGAALSAEAFSFVVEQSIDPDFETITDARTVAADVGGGTVTYAATFDGLAPATLYFYRVTASNTAGAGGASEIVSAATLGVGEVIVDAPDGRGTEVLADGSIVKVRGGWGVTEDAGAVGGDYLSVQEITQVPSVATPLSDVIYQPNLAAGRYFVYASLPSVQRSDLTTVPVDVFAGDGTGGPTTLLLDQSDEDRGFVFLGAFDFAAGPAGFVRLRNYADDFTTFDTVLADAIRFQPAESGGAVAAAVRRPTPFADGPPIGSSDDDEEGGLLDLLA